MCTYRERQSFRLIEICAFNNITIMKNIDYEINIQRFFIYFFPVSDQYALSPNRILIIKYLLVSYLSF